MNNKSDDLYQGRQLNTQDEFQKAVDKAGPNDIIPVPEGASISKLKPKQDRKTRGELAAIVGKMISEDRNNTHGDPHEQFKTANNLKMICKLQERSETMLSMEHREALDMILTKISRIIHGASNHRDHWLDIAGYALIAAEACDKEVNDA